MCMPGRLFPKVFCKQLLERVNHSLLLFAFGSDFQNVAFLAASSITAIRPLIKIGPLFSVRLGHGSL